MKKIISILIAFIIVLSIPTVYALNVDDAYNEFKSAHPDFIESLTSGGIPEPTIISFIKDVYAYLQEMDKVSPVTADNLEEKATQAITDVSSREAYYSLQDTLLILYPDAIRLAITEGKVADEFKPLVETIKKILFAETGGNSGGSSGGNSGGSSGGNSGNNDEKKEEIIVMPEPLPETPTAIFTDVASSHWAFNAINKLSSELILSGYLDGSFKPDNNITRAEFAKIIVSATNSLDIEASSQFSDVKSSDWYYYYVSTAYKLGFINGYPDGSFKPEKNITRSDICTIVNRVIKGYAADNIKTFSDDAAIPAYAKDAVYALTSMGIINGYADGSFAPGSYATRAQTAKIIFAALFK